MKHNETVNVWSHLIGVMLMLLLITLLGFTFASTFSSSGIENTNIQKINSYFNPLYDKIVNFTQLE